MKYVICIVVVFLLYQQWGVNAAAAELNEKHGAEVIMYSTSWCGYCKKARVMLNLQGVKFKEFDIEKSSTANAEMKSLGGHGVPVFLIQGEVVKSFNQQRVMALIKGI